ncbi:hypothetical protein BN2476_370016 [Paraburkholderia piptadeniae]|uniref:Uncharacterized protein n=1 Tax=Paraburkholderia piptadeniae TaxID=1701573 RepID=A0A1N7S9K1_9BURK|nr:hypothetical protein BN2476_370016 [Paraburkholderia piptadeniae]
MTLELDCGASALRRMARHVTRFTCAQISHLSNGARSQHSQRREIRRDRSKSHGGKLEQRAHTNEGKAWFYQFLAMVRHNSLDSLFPNMVHSPVRIRVGRWRKPGGADSAESHHGKSDEVQNCADRADHGLFPELFARSSSMNAIC